jgi:transposase/regulator of replication initiation timing
MQGQDNIHGLITYLSDSLNALEKIVSEHKVDIDIVKSDNKALKLENEKLKFENKDLKSQLAASKIRKNSNNSSKPPSSDFGKPNRTNSLRKSSGKKIGGQSGHKGSSMKMVSNPDVTEEHHPSYCNGCGNDLANIQPEFLGKRQVVDLPEIIPLVTEHRVYRKVCSCGRETKGTYANGVDAPISYGNNTQALIAYLSARQYIPYKRLEELLRNIFGLNICQGSIKNILDKTSNKLKPMYETIRKSVSNSTVNRYPNVVITWLRGLSEILKSNKKSADFLKLIKVPEIMLS